MVYRKFFFTIYLSRNHFHWVEFSWRFCFKYTLLHSTQKYR